MAEDWGTPPLFPEPTADGHDGSSQELPGVDEEVSAMVENAFAHRPRFPSAAPETSAQEIDLAELGLGELVEIGEDGLPKDAAYVSDAEFDNAPRAEGASLPPKDQAGSVSFKVLSTLIQLEGVIGRNLSEAARDMSDAEATALETLMLKGQWPDDEDAARAAVITVMKELQPKYRKGDRWTQQGFTSLKNLFLQELQGTNGDQLKKLAAKLRTKPPPMPKAPRPSK